MLTVYVKEDCPYCQLVKDKIEEFKIQEEKYEFYTVGKDFTKKKFKKKYGDDATFPRGYYSIGVEIIYIGGSSEIVKLLESHSL